MDNTQDVLDAILRSGIVLPSPSPALLRLQQVALDDECGPREITAVVEKDPALVGALMRVATSPVFRVARAPKSTFEVVSMLGRTKTVAIATSEALRAQASGIDELVVATLWGASARCAELAWHLARHSRQRGLEDVAYLAALLHEVGVAVLLRRYPEQQELFRKTRSANDRVVAELDANLQMDHTRVSGQVLRNWKLPTPVIEAVEAHHNPQTPGASKTALALATLIAGARLLRDGDEEAFVPWEPLAHAALNLDGATIGALRGHLDKD